ncbi:MAG: hypothetical protein ACRD2L_14855, partial [Terriglobia bacterium]
MADFDPKKFIDREFEQELFEDLLQLKDQTRILAIRDSGGMGKTQLLQKLQYRCRTVKPRTPVSFISLDQLSDNHPLTLIKRIEQDLTALGLKFPNFEKYDRARISGDFSPILSYIDLQDADFKGASDIKMAGKMVNVEGSQAPVNVNLSVGELTPEQEASAREACLRVFFDDLKEQCAENPVVLLFDAYEKCEKSLKKWIEETNLLEKHFFDLTTRPKRLVLVVAGRETPKFETRWAPDD